MPQLIYSELVSWYRLLDPYEDHVDEATAYEAGFLRVAPRAATLLELGSGAGHNAAYLKRRFQCTLTDLSEDMLALSRELNPECEHVQGDMRSLRLGRTFDVVLVHDAVMYMTSEEDLVAAARTAFAHTNPGGAAIFAPDCMRETFRDESEVFEGQDGARQLRCLAWTWDPDPADTTYVVDYAFLLRDASTMTPAHDRHVEGLFPRAAWEHVLRSVGYDLGVLHRPIGNGDVDEVFLCRRQSQL
jgi:trans-aconitate methyltransferase